MSFQEKLSDLMREFIDPQIFKACRNRVLTGPFAGMEIARDEFWNDGNSGLKILGLYEAELHNAINISIVHCPNTVINIGCADGYYAIGMARRLPEAKVYAFDIDPRGFNTCAALAIKNGVQDRVITRQGCQFPDELNVGGDPPHLFILDCEGAEIELLKKDICPLLAVADIIVECHDFKFEFPTVSDVLYNYFADTHDIKKIEQKLPDLNPPGLEVIQPENHIIRALLLTEKRPLDMCWLVMRAKGAMIGF